MSTLMFWNKQNNNNQNNSSNNETKNGGKRNWLHAPDALLNGHVVYLVKFLGTTPVEQPKGIEVVKDAIRRLQFAQQMKKVDTGNQSKLKKVEITVSVDGVAVQEPRTQKILHQFPLHNISYCADEKGVKKFFSFIAKNGTQQPDQQNNNNNNDIKINGHLNGNNNNNSTNNNQQNEEHECFVFVSSKLASDITLTIGQAFDLAYKRYMNENGKTTELSKIQQQNKQLENTVMLYKNRLKELSEITSKTDLEKMLNRLGIRDLYEIPQLQNSNTDEINGNKKSISESSNDDKLLIETGNNGTSFVPIIPPRQNLQNQINNTLDAFKPSGQKMSELLLNSDSDSDFDPRADESDNNNKISNDLFGFEPPKTFGQQLFTNNNNNINNNNNYNNNNINNRTISPPPLLAPPPKAAVPRRNTGLNNGGSQDLFGSTPFNPNTPSIFDGKFNENDEQYQATTATSVKSSISYNDISSTSINTSPQQYQTPSLQLNSTPFGDPTSDPFVTNFNMNIHQQHHQNKIINPFNESGFYDMSAAADSSTSITNKINAANVLSDLHTLSNNSDTLDSILHSSLLEDNKNLESSGSASSIGFKSMNHQQTNNNFNGISSGIFNPFTNKSDSSLLNPRNNISNYDALRNSPDLDSMQLTPASNNTASSSPIFIKNNNNNNSSNYGGSSGDKSPANNNSYDIFKDAASKAFSEFNPDNSSLTKIAYEFSNKMAGPNFGYQQKSNFSAGNNNKQSLVDDFSLESLDPLRK